MAVEKLSILGGQKYPTAKKKEFEMERATYEESPIWDGTNSQNYYNVT